MAIACDRKCAVKDPLHYVKNNSKRHAATYVYCVWLSCVSLAFPILFGFPEIDYDTCDIKVSSAESIFDPAVMYEATITFAAFIVPLLSIVYLYYGMYRAARNNTPRDDRYSSSSYISSDVVVNIKSPRSSGDSEYSLRRHFCIREGENSQQRNHFLKKHRAAVTGLLAVMSFMFCWSPYFIVRFYQKFRVVTIQLKLWIHFSTLMSSIVDPYIYFYRNRSTWNYTKKLASKIFHKKKSSMYPSNNIRSRIADVRHLYHISTRISQTVADNQLMVNRNFCRFSKNEQNDEVQITLHKQDSPKKIQDKQSTVTKQLVHDDSASSNYNSDFSPTIVSSDFCKVMHIQVLKKTFSDDSSSE